VCLVCALCKLLCSQHRALFLPLSFPEPQERLPVIRTSSGYTGRAPASHHVMVQSSLAQPLCLKEKVFMTCPLTAELSRRKYNSDNNTDQVAQFTQLPKSSPSMEAAENTKKAEAKDFFFLK